MTNQSVAASALTATDEHTDRRIRSYLAAVVPYAGLVPDEAHHRGRALIERMAVKSIGTGDPQVRLTPAECADVLEFVSEVEPMKPREFLRWDEPSPQMGLHLVLRTLQRELRRRRT